jgi:hypothetical protein
MPNRQGSSQANALTATTIVGGKPGGSPGPVMIGQPLHSFFKKPFPPLAYDLSRNIELGGNFIIGETLRSQKYDLGTYHQIIR